METQQILARSHEKNLAATWDEPHRYTPTSRHRRRIILNAIANLDFADCLDAGCAQPYLLQEIVNLHKVAGFGCDVSDKVMVTNQEIAPDCHFQAFDLAERAWPGGRQFDLVICSEVLEHIQDWETAVANLVSMTRKYLLITVPGGKLRSVEKMLGHYRHYQGPELVAALNARGCTDVNLWYWGFPVFSLYKMLISNLSPEKLFSAYCSGEQKYSLSQKLVAHGLNLLFYLNMFNAGAQLFILVRVPQKNSAGK